MRIEDHQSQRTGPSIMLTKPNMSVKMFIYQRTIASKMLLKNSKGVEKRGLSLMENHRKKQALSIIETK